MTIHLINPSELSFGTAVITCRWPYVLARATPPRYGDAVIVDETLETTNFDRIQPGDIVGISIHTMNASRGYMIGVRARHCGAYVVFGGVHASLFPNEAFQLGAAHSVVTGDGDLVWAQVLWCCQTACMVSRGRCTPAGGSTEIGWPPPAGISCRPIGICGGRCRPSGGAQSIARSVPSGEPTANGRG
jgi:hypothetical protein